MPKGNQGTTVTMATGRILVRPDKEETKTPGGIVLPDRAREVPQRGKIVAVGRGKRRVDGTYEQMEFVEGSRVLFEKFAGVAVEIEGEELVILEEKDLLARIG